MSRGAHGRNPHGHGDPWSPPPPRPGADVSRHQRPEVGTDTLSGAISHFREEHPFHVQGEGLQNSSVSSIHHRVTSSTYGGKT